jgi:hypothetical protein
MGEQVFSVFVGTVLLMASYILIVGRRDAAEGVYKWTHRGRELPPKSERKWWIRYFRPTMEQSAKIALLISVSGLTLGTAFIAIGLVRILS